MVQRRFNGNHKGEHQRRPTPTKCLPQKSRPPKRKAHLLTPQNKSERQSNDMANTAVDLDENGHKLVYQKDKDGPDGELWLGEGCRNRYYQAYSLLEAYH
jgi:hypothetical protein